MIKEILKDQKKFEEAAKQGFIQVDVNKSGYIEKVELETVLRTFATNNDMPSPSPAEIDSIYKSLDIDKNGKIDFNEFKKFFRQFLEMNK